MTVEFIAPAAATVPVKFAAEEIVWPLIRPEVIVLEPKARAPLEVIAPEFMVPMLTRFPFTSILLVPPPAPVLMPVVPFKVRPIMVLVVAIVPKPETMEPVAKAPTVVISVPTNLEAAMVPAVISLLTIKDEDKRPLAEL